MQRILVSACLLGWPVRYDGGHKALSNQLLSRWISEGRLVALCPESAAGMPTPRPAAEHAPGASASAIIEGHAKIYDKTGANVTSGFLHGAQIALQTARQHGCKYALLKDGSPSCGSAFVYAGNFDGKTRSGNGVVAQLLKQNDIEVFSESEIESLSWRLRDI